MLLTLPANHNRPSQSRLFSCHPARTRQTWHSCSGGVNTHWRCRRKQPLHTGTVSALENASLCETPPPVSQLLGSGGLKNQGCVSCHLAQPFRSAQQRGGGISRRCFHPLKTASRSETSCAHHSGKITKTIFNISLPVVYFGKNECSTRNKQLYHRLTMYITQTERKLAEKSLQVL